MVEGKQDEARLWGFSIPLGNADTRAVQTKHMCYELIQEMSATWKRQSLQKQPGEGELRAKRACA